MSNINAEGVKSKLQSLITASNAKTGKSDANLTDAVKTLLDGYGKGGGECDKPHVVEVEELPEVGEIGTIYKLVKKDLVSLAQKDDEGKIFPDAIGLLLFIFGGTVTPDEYYNYAKTPDTDNFLKESYYYVESEDAIYAYNTDNNIWEMIKSGGEEGFHGTITSIDQITADSPPGMYALIENEYEYYEYISKNFKYVQFQDGAFTYLNSVLPIVTVPTRPTENIIDSLVTYYIEDENAFLVYNSDTGEWEAFSLTGDEELKIIDDLNQITEEGMYILRSGEFRKCNYPTKTQIITEPGIYDVKDMAMININYDSVHGAWKLGNDDIGMYGTVNVNFTTIYNGEVIKCIGMRYEQDLMDIDDLFYILEDGSEIAVDLYVENYYVDFGKESQMVPKTFADFVRRGTPIYDQLVEVETEEAMNALLEVAEIGTVYRYTGPTTENYQNGALYVVHLPMVSFTIDGADHQGEEDMTWTEWCASEYNTIGCVNTSTEELIYNSDNTKQLMLNDTAVYGKDVLVADAAYVFITIPVEEPSTEEPNEHGTTVIVNQYSEEDNDYGTTVVIGEEDEAVNLISFSVDSKTYQAEDGMTWAEWIDSEYNTDGYYLGGGIVQQPGGINVLDSDGDQQISTDTIKANETYKHGTHSGGSGN